MHFRSVLRFLVIAHLQSGLMCSAGFGATGTSSIAVSVTVEAGCQVSQAVSAAGNATSGLNRWNAPVSVNCSLPVPYQVAFDRAPRTDFAGLGSSIGNLAGRPGDVQVYDRDLLQRGDMLIEPIERSESGLDEHVSPGLPAWPLEAAHCAADGADSGIITVTVIY
jgi:hypothetical protein